MTGANFVGQVEAVVRAFPEKFAWVRSAGSGEKGVDASDEEAFIAKWAAVGANITALR